VVGGPHRLVEPIVKWASQVTSPHTLYQSVVRAGEMAQRNPKGPTYLNVPVETMLKEWAKPEEARPVPSAPTMRPAQEDIDRVAEVLVAARCPVIMAESAGRDPAAFHALVELAEMLAIPVVEARAGGYANFPKDHPLYLGSDETRFLGETDLVLAVASRAPWYPPDNRPRNATVVALSDNPLKGHMAYQNLAADLYLEGDVATSIELLIEAVRSSGVTTDAHADRARRWASEHEAMLARQRTREAAADHKSKPIDPLVLLAAMRERLPGDVIYVDETVVHSAALHAHLSWSGPQSYFRVPTGLGQGLGVALGVKMASPKRPVVLLIGDGTFMYNPVIAALNFARANDLPILVVVFNNGKYQAMKKNHLGYYPDGLSATSQIFHGVTLDGPDYAALAAMFGGYGRKVEDPAQIGPALTEAMAALSDGKVAILNVVLSA